MAGPAQGEDGQEKRGRQGGTRTAWEAMGEPPPAQPWEMGAAQKQECITQLAPVSRPRRTFQKLQLAQGQRLSQAIIGKLCGC